MRILIETNCSVQIGLFISFAEPIAHNTDVLFMRVSCYSRLCFNIGKELRRGSAPATAHFYVPLTTRGQGNGTSNFPPYIFSTSCAGGGPPALQSVKYRKSVILNMLRSSCVLDRVANAMKNEVGGTIAHEIADEIAYKTDPMKRGSKVVEDWKSSPNGNGWNELGRCAESLSTIVYVFSSIYTMRYS